MGRSDLLRPFVLADSLVMRISNFYNVSVRCCTKANILSICVFTGGTNVL